jgi:hypothetical protein
MHLPILKLRQVRRVRQEGKDLLSKYNLRLRQLILPAKEKLPLLQLHYPRPITFKPYIFHRLAASLPNLETADHPQHHSQLLPLLRTGHYLAHHGDTPLRQRIGHFPRRPLRPFRPPRTGDPQRLLPRTGAIKHQEPMLAVPAKHQEISIDQRRMGNLQPRGGMPGNRRWVLL